MSPRRFDYYDNVDWNPCASEYNIIKEKPYSETEILRRSMFILALMYDNTPVLHKNRFGVVNGKLTLDETIDVVSELLVRVKLDGRMDLFQEGMKTQLKEAINSIVNSEKKNEGVDNGKSDI